jgi:saccharopine dehydrogenase-like NADP-dependent oxidoreductase
MVLASKNTIIYGAGGAIGSGVAKAFARDGASVFLAGRTRESLDDAAFQGLLSQLDQMRMLRKSPRLAQIADVTVFLASDQAAAITAIWVNVTGGMFAS